MDDLPEEIIWEILVRTPAHYLLRLKTICKVWFRIISSPDFVDAHLYYARFNSPRAILHSEGTSDFSAVKLEREQEKEQGTFLLHESFDLRIRECIHDRQIYIFDSCNGVLLLASVYLKYSVIKPWYLYNPITRESTKFILPNVRYSQMAREWALVYDDSIQQFKVIGISHDCMIFTMMSDFDPETGFITSPRHLTSPHSLPSNFRPTYHVLVKKKLHWLVEIEYKECKECMFVYSLDVAKEEIGTIKLIPNSSQNLSIFQMDESLCVADYNDVENRLDIWTLADSGKNLWNKTRSIGTEFKLRDNSIEVYHFPISKSDRKHVLIRHDKPYFYDFTTGKMTEKMFSGIMFKYVHIHSLTKWK